MGIHRRRVVHLGLNGFGQLFSQLNPENNFSVLLFFPFSEKEIKMLTPIDHTS